MSSLDKYTSLRESSTRKKIDQWLIDHDWNIDEESPSCNVTTERALTPEQRAKLKGKEPDYVLYKSKTREPIGVIEARTPGEDLKKALEDAIKKYAEPLEIPIVFASNGTLVATWHMWDRKELAINGQPLTTLVSEKTLLKFVEHGASITQTSEQVKYTREELIRIFAWANELLRKEGLRGLNRFVEFANILFLKLISETEHEKEKTGEKRILDEKYCWKSFAHLPPEMMMAYINDTVLPHLVDRYNRTGDVFQSKMQIKSPTTLEAIVNKVSELTLINADSDIKGDAFEYFLKSIGSGTDLGEYFTPRHIVKTMVNLIAPKFGEKVYDPACGTGGFLIEAFRQIKRGCKPTSENLHTLKKETVYGIELTDTARIAKMNMILAGDGHTNIFEKDSLANPVKDRYDVVVTNFPFSQRTDYGHLYGFKTHDANPVFLKHIIDSLKNGGRAAVVTFQGVLYDKKATYAEIRRLLLEHCDMKAVIKLHNYVFRPYSGANTSILLFEKGRPTKTVWFFKVDEDGFEKTSSKKGRRPIEQNDLELLEKIWPKREVGLKSWTADFETIRSKNYNLDAEAYRPRSRVLRGWNFERLEDCASLIKGSEVGSHTYCERDAGVPFIRVGDLTGKRTGASVNTLSEDIVEVKPEDILMSFDGTPGVVGRGFSGAISAGIRKVESKDETKLLNDFLFFMLQAKQVQEAVDAYSKTSTITHASEAIKRIEIPIPPLDFQAEYVATLKPKLRMISNIDMLLQNLDAEPIDGLLFDEDWPKTALGELMISDPQNGLYKPLRFYNPKGVPIVRIDNIYDGELIIENMKRLKVTTKEIETYQLRQEDIVLNRVNSLDYIGKCCVYGGEFPVCVFESNMMRFTVDKSRILPHYVVFYISSEHGKKQIHAKAKPAVNQVSINQTDVKALMIPLPPKEEQERIVKAIQSQLAARTNLRHLRDRLKREIELSASKISSQKGPDM